MKAPIVTVIAVMFLGYAVTAFLQIAINDKSDPPYWNYCQSCENKQNVNSEIPIWCCKKCGAILITR